ncbi:MAG: dipeptidase PepV [Oscillospiraceae bacterium]
MTIKESIASDRSKMVESLRGLVKIRSVQGMAMPGCPFGEEIQKSLDYCLRLGKSMGLRTGSMDNHVGWCEYGDGEELICALTHLDIVPEGEGWAYPPFGGVIADGRIYGRGTLDNKGPAIAAIYALKALAQSGIPLRRRVRVMFGLNEETGCAGVCHYVSNGGEIPVMAFTPDAEFPIINGEKGAVAVEYRRYIAPSARGIHYLHAGIAPNVVPAVATAELGLPMDEVRALIERPFPHCTLGFADGGIVIKAKGRGAHASTPEKGVNAICRLIGALSELNPDGDSAESIDFIKNTLCTDVNGKGLGIYCRDALSGEITVNLGLMCVVNGEASLTLDIRYPVTRDANDFVPIMRAKMAAGGFEEISFRHNPSIYMPPESALIQTLQRVYENETGTKAELLCMGGGTYAKTMPNCVAFGPIFPGEEMLDHQPNEYITVNNLIKNAEIYVSAMYELAK